LEWTASYRETFKYDHFAVGLSVCIQKMVRSDLGSSGVAFSLDTESGFKEAVVINGSYGLGEMVVQGSVSPDEFIVFKPMLDKGFKSIVEKKLGVKDQMMVYSEDAQERVKIIDVDKDMKERFCIDDEKIIHFVLNRFMRISNNPELAALYNFINRHTSRLHTARWRQNYQPCLIFILYPRAGMWVLKLKLLHGTHVVKRFFLIIISRMGLILKIFFCLHTKFRFWQGTLPLLLQQSGVFFGCLPEANDNHTLIGFLSSIPWVVHLHDDGRIGLAKHL
jgi:hypothetical protein